MTPYARHMLALAERVSAFVGEFPVVVVLGFAAVSSAIGSFLFFN